MPAPATRKSTHIVRPALVLLIFSLVAVTSCTALPPPANEVTQISTYPALQKGLYDGDVTYAQLAQAGNFGIGTFDGMDGEMIALDGVFYQARADGTVAPAASTLESPFATVVYFTADRRLQPVEAFLNYDALKAYLTKVAPPANRPYAIKVEGTFPYIKIRSVPKQSEPFPPLSDVVAQQTIWERNDIRGTLVGYWFPEYLSDLNAPGYHLHFISNDRQVAGHLLDGSVEDAVISIDNLDRVTLRIPENDAFGAADFTATP